MIIRNFEDADITTFKIWLNKPYIKKWYQDTDAWLKEVTNRKGEFSFIHHYIAEIDGKAVGFCQWYDVKDSDEDCYKGISHKTYSIDYFIGEEEFLGRGYGKELVGIITEEALKYGAEKIAVQPESDNHPSCKSLLANGYFFDNNMRVYIFG